MNVNFKTFLKQKYDKWASEHEGGYKGFAEYLGVPPTSLSNWMNSGHTPGKASIAQLTKILGYEIYEVLGLAVSYESLPTDFRRRLDEADAEILRLRHERNITNPDSPEALALASEVLERYGFKVTITP